jgi:replicative DNA helicase
VFIDDTPGITVLEMRSKARRLKSDHGLDLVIVDYLQLMSGPSAENRQQEVSQISRGLKALAKELQIPVVALSQLSRAVDQRAAPSAGGPCSATSRVGRDRAGRGPHHVPLPRGGLRRARERAAQGPGRRGEGRGDHRQAAQRPIGAVPLFFHKQYTRFEGVAKREYQGE